MSKIRKLKPCLPLLEDNVFINPYRSFQFLDKTSLQGNRISEEWKYQKFEKLKHIGLNVNLRYFLNAKYPWRIAFARKIWFRKTKFATDRKGPRLSKSVLNCLVFFPSFTNFAQSEDLVCKKLTNFGDVWNAVSDHNEFKVSWSFC